MFLYKFQIIPRVSCCQVGWWTNLSTFSILPLPSILCSLCHPDVFHLFSRLANGKNCFYVPEIAHIKSWCKRSLLRSKFVTQNKTTDLFYRPTPAVSTKGLVYHLGPVIVPDMLGLTTLYLALMSPKPKTLAKSKETQLIGRSSETSGSGSGTSKR